MGLTLWKAQLERRDFPADYLWSSADALCHGFPAPLPLDLNDNTFILFQPDNDLSTGTMEVVLSMGAHSLK